jgi:hypothetical protein
LLSFLRYFAESRGLGRENVASGALAYLLDGSSLARERLKPFVDSFQAGSLPDRFSVKAQTYDKDSKRPDITLSHNDSPRVRIEFKFDAELTDAQKDGSYFEGLPIPGLVLFVVPPVKLRKIWKELLAAYSLPEPRATGFTVSYDKHTLAITTWDALLNSLSSEFEAYPEAARDEQRDIENLVKDLRGICMVPKPNSFKPLVDSDLNRETGSKIETLFSLAMQIASSSFDDELYKKTGTFGDTWSYSGCGLYGNISGLLCWIGIETNMWGTYGLSPVWVDIIEYKNPVKVRGYLKRKIFTEDGKHLYIPILLKQGVDRTALLEDAGEQIEMLRNELGEIVKRSMGKPANAPPHTERN